MSLWTKETRLNLCLVGSPNKQIVFTSFYHSFKDVGGRQVVGAVPDFFSDSPPPPTPSLSHVPITPTPMAAAPAPIAFVPSSASTSLLMSKDESAVQSR